MTKRFFTWITAWVVAGLATIFVVLLSATQFGDEWRTFVSRGVETKIQSAFGRTLPIDQSLMIFEIRQSTFSAIGIEELQPSHWALLIRRLNHDNPSALIIEPILDFSDTADLSGLEALQSSLASVEYKVFAGARVLKNQEGGKSPVDDPEFFEQRFAIRKWQRTGELVPHWVPPIPNPQPNVVLPHPQIIDELAGVGYIGGLRSGFARPMERLGDFWFVPHLSLTMAKRLAVFYDYLSIDGKEGILDNDGRITVDRPSGSILAKKAQPFEKLWQGLVVDRAMIIPEEAHILILDGYDRRWGRNSNHNESRITTGLTNSVIQGRWIHTAAHEKRWILMASVLGVFAGMYLSLSWLRNVLLFGWAALPLFGLTTFVLLRTTMPWLYPGLSLWIVTGAVLAIRSALSERNEEQQEEEPLAFVNDEEMAALDFDDDESFVEDDGFVEEDSFEDAS